VLLSGLNTDISDFNNNLIQEETRELNSLFIPTKSEAVNRSSMRLGMWRL